MRSVANEAMCQDAKMPTGKEAPSELLRGALRRVLSDNWQEAARKDDLRQALRDACEWARRESLRAEQLLLVLKDAWRELPERRHLPHVDADDLLAAVVTACIEEYYRSPGTSKDVQPEREWRSEAGEVRTDSQSAEANH